MLIISKFWTKKTKQNVIRTGVLSVNLVSTDMLEHNRGYTMKINLEKNESIFCQIIANVLLLVELENNKFLGSNYYREMKWSCSESNKKILILFWMHLE